MYTADTGASKTVLSKRVYDSMRPEDKPPLSKSSKLVGAGGTYINEIGKGNFKLQLGPVCVQTEAIVAKIDDDGLLGIDVLQNRHDGPTDLMMSKGILKMGDKEVPIMQVGITDRIRKVTAADYSIIPAHSETVIAVYVERKEYDDFTSESEYIIEPTEHFQEEYPLLMAAAIVDINQGCTSKVRLLNPFPTEVSIKQNAVLGQAEPIEKAPEMQAEQEDIKGGNHSSVRRIQVINKDDTLSPEIHVKQSKRVNESNTVYIPKHLTSLYEEASASLKIDEQAKLKAFLMKFQDNCTKHKWDPGGTNLLTMGRDVRRPAELVFERVRQGQEGDSISYLLKEVQKALLQCSQ